MVIHNAAIVADRSALNFGWVRARAAIAGGERARGRISSAHCPPRFSRAMIDMGTVAHPRIDQMRGARPYPARARMQFPSPLTRDALPTTQRTDVSLMHTSAHTYVHTSDPEHRLIRMPHRPEMWISAGERSRPTDSPSDARNPNQKQSPDIEEAPDRGFF